MVESTSHSERLEIEIRGYFGSHSIEIVETEEGGVIQLALVTKGEEHGQKFLFHKSRGAYRQQALEDLLDYIKDHRAKESTYTVQWRAFNESELHTSYFSAPNIKCALEKFFFGRDIHSITVFSVSLNPIS
jgi:hypothetical protein